MGYNQGWILKARCNKKNRNLETLVREHKAKRIGEYMGRAVKIYR